MSANADATEETPDTERVLVSRAGPPRLHLPGEDGPLCSVQGNLREKPLAVYPPAHRTWCRYCLAAWRARTGAESA